MGGVHLCFLLRVVPRHSEPGEELGLKYSFREERKLPDMEEIVSRLNDLDKEIEKTMVRL